MKNFSHVIGIGICVIAALVISASTAQAQNLLVNGDFEDAGGFTAFPIYPETGGINHGWAPLGLSGPVGQSDMSGSADHPQSGSYALLAELLNGATDIGAYQITSVSVTAGMTYNLSIWALTDTGTVSGTPVSIGLAFKDSPTGSDLAIH